MPRLDVETGRSIAYEHYAGARRPVMLIHGWGAQLRVWDAVLAALLEAGHAVVSFDQRCCGASDKDFRTVSIAASAGDAVALVDHLDLRGIVLNGWSLGGAIAVEAASRLGDRCGGVVSTAGATPRYTAADDFPHGGPAQGVRETIAAIRADRVGILSQVAKAVMAKPDAASTAWIAGMFLQMSPGGDQALLDLAEIDQRAGLATLTKPFLSVVGGKDSFVPPEIGRLAAALAPHGRVVEFPECGHAPFLEDGGAYRAALLGFLAELG